ncbi:MAG: hypothetical protein A2289_05625 [Deltaproteobacteria bacterium RIFOXYA12_FULL_58_15]|nr:MAG: hypothetical protein A2289_05625 [Deltaproteobacteria bacterium RIFOXYA12_FULL_58_15]
MKNCTAMLKICLFIPLMVALGCTDSDIYTATGVEPYRPDRIAITGRLCTEDITGPNFPVKILTMIDTTNAMFNADPDLYRFCGPGASTCASGSLNGFVDRMRNQQNVRLGFAGISNVSKPITPVPAALCQPPPCDAQQFFSGRDIDGGLLQSALSLPTGNQRDISNAISQAESFITADMASSSAGEILRSRYLVFMLLAGPPTNSVATSQLVQQVEHLRDFVYSKGALEFRLNIGLLYFGNRSITAPPTGYGCHLPEGSTACSCGGSCVGDNPNYCSACCATAGSPPSPFGSLSWEVYNEQASQVYSALSFAGDGLFREFECPAVMEIRLDAAATSIQLKRKDIVAYNINVKLAIDGPVIDSDGDGLADYEEARAQPHTNTDNWDTDGDGLSDRLEFRAFPRQDPTDNTDRPASCPDPEILGIIPDQDLDLLNDCEEGLLQTSPSIPDTDGDGLPDALEFMSSTVPTSADDRLLDFDGDGIANAEEVLAHTNPRTNDGRLRGAEGYRTEIIDLGIRTVSDMEDTRQLRAISFRSASNNVVGGAGLLRWNYTGKTMSADGRDASPRSVEWSDARWQIPPYFTPIPTVIDEGSGMYTLRAESASTGEILEIKVYVHENWLPDEDTEVFPLISTSDRNCYDVQISNIKLLQTREAEDIIHVGETHEEGTNHILVFFTQAPEDRLDSPGIAKVAVLDPVIYRCTDPNDIESCARNPDSGFLEITDADFAASVP